MIRCLTLLMVLLTAACDGLPWAQGSGVVEGEAFYLQKIALPEDAVLTVRLDDVTQTDAPAETIDSRRIELDGRQQPFAFELRYHPEKLKSNRVYAVAGRIEDSSGLRFISTEPHTVLLTGEPQQVRLKLDQVSASGEAAALSATPHFSCRGNEPFWNLNLDKSELELSRLMDEVVEKTYEGRFSRFSAPGGGAGYQWQGEAAGGWSGSQLVADITLEHCVDSMAGPQEGGEFDYSIRMLVGDETLHGCCNLLTAQPSGTQVSYSCDGDIRVQTRYENRGDNGQLLLQLPDGRDIWLAQQVSASGARYVHGAVEFWSKGDNAMLTLEPGDRLNCTAVDPDE